MESARRQAALCQQLQRPGGTRQCFLLRLHSLQAAAKQLQRCRMLLYVCWSRTDSRAALGGREQSSACGGGGRLAARTHGTTVAT